MKPKISSFPEVLPSERFHNSAGYSRMGRTFPQFSKPQQGRQGCILAPAPVSLKKNYIKDKIIKCVPKHKFIAWRE